MDWNSFSQYAFYLALVVISGAGEYIHLAPMGTLVGILGLVVGHFFGNGTTKAALSQLLAAVKSSTVVPVESAKIQIVPLSLKETTEATSEQGGNK